MMFSSLLLRYEVWLQRSLLLILMIASVYSAVVIFLSFMPKPSLELPSIVLVNNAKSKKVSTITSDSFFGSVVTSERTVTPTRKTKLRLTLKGVMPSLEMKNALAILATKNNVDDVFQVGQDVVPGVLLTAVYNDHVILNRGGSLESLFFAENNVLTLVENIIEKTGENVTENSTDSSLSVLTSKILSLSGTNNSDTLFDSMGLQSMGSVYQVLDTSLLISLGLKAGDKIVAINGLSVGSIKGDESFEDVMQKQDVALFQVLRGSRSFSVSYPIN